MTDFSSFDWKTHIIECLRSTDYCCLATVDENGTWANPVYFSWDEQFQLYFISQMHSRHMQNLQLHPHVAVAIYSTAQKEDVVGIQLAGQAAILQNDLPEIQHAFDVYYARAGKGPDVQQYINNPEWIFVRVIPDTMYYFDTRFFGEERQEVPKFW